MTEAREISDPERLAELRWGAAIKAWERRDPAPLIALINALPVPAFAAELLRELAEGTAKHPPGTPEARSPAHERRIAFATFEAWDRFASGPRSSEGSPKDRAIASAAERFGMRPEQVRGVLQKVTREGLTRDVWARYLRDT